MNDRLLTLLKARQRARTDLWYLMDVLGYKDVDREVHGPLVDNMPKFLGGKEEILSNNRFVYTPMKPLWEMESVRKRLFLYPRGHLKTSIISQAGTIQWILNYPDIRILITTATADLAETILGEIKSHFQYNEMFRFIFKDFCPTKGVKDWGNASEFSIRNRKKEGAREATCSASSVGKTIAGKHFEVLLCSDMVDKENIKTPGGIRDVIGHYTYMDPLLERHEYPEGSELPNHGWVTVEGTSYSFADLYSKLLNDNGFRITEFGPGVEVRKTEDWTFVHGDAEVDEKTQKTIWPSRFPWKELKKMERSMGMSIYSAQMKNRPIADEGGLISEDLLSKKGFWFNSKVLDGILHTLRIHTTVDLAGMESASRGDYTVLTTAGFDRNGRCYVMDIRRGHFTPSEVIWHIFDINKTFKPIDIKIEKDAHQRVLGHFLRREMQKRQVFPTIIELKRETRTSKVERIKGLEPWFQARVIRFFDDLDHKTDLFREVVEFPNSKFDDITDTLADQMQNRDGGINYDVIPYDKETADEFFALPKFAGFDPITGHAELLWDKSESVSENYHDMTGL